MNKSNAILKLGLGLLILIGLSGCASSSSPAQSTFDPKTGKFAPCPDSPNCVSTAASDEEHAIEPYSFTGSATDAKARMVSIVNDMPRSKIVGETENTLHVEFRSRVFRFVDDVEFFFDEADSLVQFRSASRTGYSDMGVNRKRMEESRTNFETDAR
jgi:uncharacterized protein (DUF1499 family)